MKILFLLPVSGGGGGAHSVVQEVNEMLLMGINASIAINQSNMLSMQVNYADMPLVVGKFIPFNNADDLVPLIQNDTIVVATIFTSVKILKNICDKRKDVIPAYYMQDYEPLFSIKGSKLWHEARDSYTLIKNIHVFTKTQWQKNILFKNHGVNAAIVKPSIDHSIYYPSFQEKSKRLCAMVRPKSARRAPYRTMRILRAVKLALPEVSIDIFGCNNDEIEKSNLVRDFKFTNHGVLKRIQVAAILRKSTFFLDSSDYQAFGRTSLEAMASGCIPIVPSVGGGYEYAINGKNSFVIDMSDEKTVIKSIIDLLNEKNEKINMLTEQAIETSQNYNIRRAVLSELNFFKNIIV